MAKTGNRYVLPQSNRIKSGVLTAAKASRANSTDAVKIFDAAADGSLLKAAWALPRGTLASAIQLQLYWSPDNGTTVYLIDSALMAAYTYAATEVIPTTEFSKATYDEPVFIPAGASVWAGAAVAEADGIVVNCCVEDYTQD